MKIPANPGGVGASALKVALLAAALLLAATNSGADPGRGRGTGQDGRTRSGGGESRYKGGGRAQSGGGERIRGGGERRYKGGGSAYGGGGGSGSAHRGGYGYGGGGSAYRGGGGYGGGYSRGGHSYGGGVRYVRPYRYSYVSPYRHGYLRPRSYVSFGIGLGLPYYCPPSYRYHVVPRPIVEEYRPAIDVENLPPAGCYYYDRACDRRFADLDSYTEHIDGEGHSNTIEIIDEDTGDLVRTLEFVGGYWEVQR